MDLANTVVDSWDSLPLDLFGKRDASMIGVSNRTCQACNLRWPCFPIVTVDTENVAPHFRNQNIGGDNLSVWLTG